MTPVLQIVHFFYTYPGADTPALRDISLALEDGECICLTGPSGCGKTTLLLAIQGLLKEGVFDGSIGIRGNGRGIDVGMVFQNADTQILCTTIEDEVRFGPQNLHLSSEEIKSRVRDALDAVGLAGFEKRNVEQLSAGEKHRLTIASVLSMGPKLLLLDEPTSQLDASGKAKLVEILTTLKNKGHALLIIDHDLAPFSALSDRFFFIEDGRLNEGLNEHLDELGKAPARHSAGEFRFGNSEQAVISINDLYVSGPDGNPLFNGAELSIYSGQLVHLHGPNGSGKSTLLRCIAGFESARAGMIRIVGVDSPRPQDLVGRVGFLFQNPERQFFEETVHAEVGFSLRRMGVPFHQMHSRIMETLNLCGVSHLADRSPFTLSFGEQHRVALASVIASKPDILLLDEPFSGLDFAQRFRTLHLLSELRQHFGTTVIIASHDPLPNTHWSDRTIILKDGTIEEF